MAIRLVARGKRSTDGVKLTVAPEWVPLSSTLGCVRGTSNVLVLETDLMGEIAIVENDPGVEQTAYALLSDMIRIHEYLA
jgi:homoserine dehydrogenase